MFDVLNKAEKDAQRIADLKVSGNTVDSLRGIGVLRVKAKKQRFPKRGYVMKYSVNDNPISRKLLVGWISDAENTAGHPE